MSDQLIELPLLAVLFGAITTDNILLARFLGMCPFLSVSSNLKASVGLSAAVVFVETCTVPLNWLVYHYVLRPLDLEYLYYIAFIIVIAAFVQVVEMAVERVSDSLYYALGIFLPLITVNCAILGASLFMVVRNYGPATAAVYGFGAGAGWALVMVIMAGIRQKMAKRSKVIPQLQGPGITLIVAGILALAFVGFSNVISITGN